MSYPTIQEIQRAAPTIDELCKAAYLNALEHGFHDAEIEYGHVPALRQAFELAAFARIHSELVEAAEATGESEKIPGFSHFVEELADVCIRIFDWCAYAHYDIQRCFNDGKMLVGFDTDDRREYLPRSEMVLAYCHKLLGHATEAVRSGGDPSRHLANVVLYLDYNVEARSTLLRAVLAKMAYNKTRPHMHGKLS